MQLPAQLLRYVAKLPIRYVADLYNPLVVELLEAIADAGAPREDALVRRVTKVVWAQCAVADFVICASETQRDLWIGGLGLSGLIDLGAYRSDRTFRAFVDVVPFGVRDTPPTRGEPVLKGVWPGIGPERPCSSGAAGSGAGWTRSPRSAPSSAWPAGAAGASRLPGRGPPGRSRPTSRRAPSEAIAFARERGLEGKHVHFNPGWVPYEERGRYLLEADLGISAHHEHLETRFSFRTRVLDYLWAGLPMVLTNGDSMAELAERRDLGITVDAEDDEGFARACAELLDDAERLQATAARVRGRPPRSAGSRRRVRWSSSA